MGSIRSIRRAIERKDRKAQSWVASSEEAIFMHFMDRPLKCENCADLEMGVCPGKGLSGYAAIKRCMDGKLLEVESGVSDL